MLAELAILACNGLNDTETRIPTMRHSIQRGELAPAILVTVLQPMWTDPNNGRLSRRKPKWVLSLLRSFDAIISGFIVHFPATVQRAHPVLRLVSCIPEAGS
jgi:hypothetical protein